jgi:hypothetical protein
VTENTAKRMTTTNINKKGWHKRGYYEWSDNMTSSQKELGNRHCYGLKLKMMNEKKVRAKFKKLKLSIKESQVSYQSARLFVQNCF